MLTLSLAVLRGLQADDGALRARPRRSPPGSRLRIACVGDAEDPLLRLAALELLQGLSKSRRAVQLLCTGWLAELIHVAEQDDGYGCDQQALRAASRVLAAADTDSFARAAQDVLLAHRVGALLLHERARAHLVRLRCRRGARRRGLRCSVKLQIIWRSCQQAALEDATRPRAEVCVPAQARGLLPEYVTY